MALPDLNLLVYLHLLIKHGSATKVAAKMQITQPGVSAATAQTVRDIMVTSVDEGWASGAKIAGAKLGGKTGTAELGSRKQFVNSWVIGFFPYENPKYAFVIMMESGPQNSGSASSVARQLLDWMSINTPEYFQ